MNWKCDHVGISDTRAHILIRHHARQRSDSLASSEYCMCDQGQLNGQLNEVQILCCSFQTMASRSTKAYIIKLLGTRSLYEILPSNRQAR